MSSPAAVSATELVDAIAKGDRNALARGITLVESTREADRQLVLDILAAARAREHDSFRVGISGTPGVGKSSLIDSLGSYLIDQGKRVAVLAVDPSSTRHGGSILGDKTRMRRLSVSEYAFVRPSPTSGMLGGVAARTREAMLLCELAGYDVIFVETVGVGQSEVEVAEVVDTMLLLLLGRSGDELQGIKRGILEVVDVVAVNKADGEGEKAAKLAAAQLSSALPLLRGRPFDVVACSALEERGIDELWLALSAEFDSLKKDGGLGVKRQEQAVKAFYKHVNREIVARLDANPDFAGRRNEFAVKVERQELSALAAAETLVDELLEKI